MFHPRSKLYRTWRVKFDADGECPSLESQAARARRRLKKWSPQFSVKKFTVLRSVGNLNNEFGLPLCLLRAERYQNIGVLEMGMSAKGEIRKLASIAEPNEGVVTNVNPVHLEFFKSVDEIAEAKAELLEGLHDPKVAYLNNDDSRVRAMARRVRRQDRDLRSEVGRNFQSAADAGPRTRRHGVHASARRKRRRFRFAAPRPAQRRQCRRPLSRWAQRTRVSWDQMREAIGEMKPEKMRGEVIKFREGFAVIDDSYNSNPRALSEMIRFVGQLQGFQTKDSRRRRNARAWARRRRTPS